MNLIKLGKLARQARQEAERAWRQDMTSDKWRAADKARREAGL